MPNNDEMTRKCPRVGLLTTVSIDAPDGVSCYGIVGMTPMIHETKGCIKADDVGGEYLLSYINSCIGGISSR